MKAFSLTLGQAKIQGFDLDTEGLTLNRVLRGVTTGFPSLPTSPRSYYVSPFDWTPSAETKEMEVAVMRPSLNATSSMGGMQAPISGFPFWWHIYTQSWEPGDHFYP
jgi:hypothetical protein